MALKTYLLAPDFTTPPDGPIQIGNIIVDPRRPFKPISIPTTSPATYVHTDIFKKTESTSATVDGGAWASFMEAAKASVGGGRAAFATASYEPEFLDTISLKAHPTDEEATILSEESPVREAMRAGPFGRRPVYLISGLKIARGLKRVSNTGRDAHGVASVTGAVSEELSVGGKFRGQREHSTEEISEAAPGPENDVIFAYQLHVIGRKGWKGSKVSADIHVPKRGEGFLSNEDKIGHVREMYEAQIASFEDIKAFTDEVDEDLNAVKLDDGTESYLCVTSTIEN